MAERKIFAGPKVRRLRQSLDLTQTAMAEWLAISPSYLNLIERNQRPLTVQLLLRLASVYKVDLEQLQAEGVVQRLSCGKSLLIRCWRAKSLAIRYWSIWLKGLRMRQAAS